MWVNGCKFVEGEEGEESVRVSVRVFAQELRRSIRKRACGWGVEGWLIRLRRVLRLLVDVEAIWAVESSFSS